MRYQDYIGKEMEIVSKSSYIRGIIKSDGNLSLNKFTNKEKRSRCTFRTLEFILENK